MWVLFFSSGVLGWVRSTVFQVVKCITFHIMLLPLTDKKWERPWRSKTLVISVSLVSSSGAGQQTNWTTCPGHRSAAQLCLSRTNTNWSPIARLSDGNNAIIYTFRNMIVLICFTLRSAQIFSLHCNCVVSAVDWKCHQVGRPSQSTSRRWSSSF